jgi:hypothetical protein
VIRHTWCPYCAGGGISAAVVADLTAAVAPVRLGWYVIQWALCVCVLESRLLLFCWPRCVKFLGLYWPLNLYEGAESTMRAGFRVQGRCPDPSTLPLGKPLERGRSKREVMGRVRCLTFGRTIVERGGR